MPTRPITPPEDSSDSSLSQSFKSDQLTTVSQSHSSQATSSPEQIRNEDSIQSKVEERVVVDDRQSNVVQNLVRQLREYQKGDLNIGPTHSIGVHEFRKLEAIIDRLPNTDPLKGFWDDKLHYEYDSGERLFRILMPSSIHERLIILISDQVNNWLEQCRKHESTCVREFASSVIEAGSTRIDFSSDKNLETLSIEEVVGSPSPSEPTSGSSSFSDTPLQSSGPASSRVLRSNNPSTRQARAPVNQTQQVRPTSEASHAATRERRYDPDNSWRFVYPQRSDKRSAFILEVAKTQRKEDLYNKIEGLIGQCEARAVLACQTDIYKSKGAYVELWESPSLRIRDEGAQTANQPTWRVDILDDQGAVPAHFGCASISLARFATENSCVKFLSRYTDDELQEWGSHPELSLDFAKLGRELVHLRESEKREMEEKTGKRRRDSRDDEVEGHTAELERETAIRRKLRGLEEW